MSLTRTANGRQTARAGAGCNSTRPCTCGTWPTHRACGCATASSAPRPPAAPAAGTYTVHVTGQAVMQDQNAVGVAVPPLVGRQGYALAATGAFPAAPASTAPPPPSAAPHITSSSVSTPSSDLAVVRWTTD